MVWRSRDAAKVISFNTHSLPLRGVYPHFTVRRLRLSGAGGALLESGLGLGAPHLLLKNSEQGVRSPGQEVGQVSPAPSPHEDLQQILTAANHFVSAQATPERTTPHPDVFQANLVPCLQRHCTEVPRTWRPGRLSQCHCRPQPFRFATRRSGARGGAQGSCLGGHKTQVSLSTPQPRGPTLGPSTSQEGAPPPPTSSLEHEPTESSTETTQQKCKAHPTFRSVPATSRPSQSPRGDLKAAPPPLPGG